MKVAMNICAAILIGLGILLGMRACNPFAYLLSDDQDTLILKGGVER